MNNQNTTVSSLDPKTIKKIEKDIKKEAKHEEAAVKHVLKDLAQTEKEDARAAKAIIGADHTLGKSEKQERVALQGLYNAEHKHDIAVTNLHKAQNDLEMQTRRQRKVHEALQAKKAHAEEVLKAHERQTQERNCKLIALHGPAAEQHGSRVIPEAGTQETRVD